MSLSNLIRRKSEPVGFATATPATFATQEEERGRTVATVATIATPKNQVMFFRCFLMTPLRMGSWVVYLHLAPGRLVSGLPAMMVGQPR